MTAPNPCPVGYYCPIGTSGSDNKVKCPAGTFSNDLNLSEVGECLPCPPGKYCLEGTSNPSANKCTAGFYCVKGSGEQSPGTNTYQIGSEINGKCPKGFYCPEETESPIPCPVGTYNPDESKTDASECVACPAGKYCDEVGIDDTDIQNKLCSPGFLCISGSQTPTPTDGTKGKKCDAGNYCQEGTTAQVQCPAGSYEPRKGTSSSTCQTCPTGYFCPIGSTGPTICPMKNYCPAGSGSATPCPNGRYNDDLTGLESSSQCKECPSGFYCTAGEIVDRCQAGYHCDTGAAAIDDSNKECPAGYYCPVHTSPDCANANGAVVDATCAACTTPACKKESC